VDCRSPSPCSTLSFFLTLRPQPRSPLFPYTTLFRSVRVDQVLVLLGEPPRPGRSSGLFAGRQGHDDVPREGRVILREFERDRHRSEEHTSELQSLTNIVCRLLLEKKNTRSAHCGSS